MSYKESLHSTDIVFSSEGFGLLRKTLYQNLGERRAEILLLNFGRKLGRDKAIELKQHYTDKHELVQHAVLTHVSLGHVADVETKGHQIQNEQGEYIFIDSIGKWFNSFEADLHVQNHKKSDRCACHILSGFASGYLSEVYETTIFVVELTCKAMGYPDCTFEVNTKKQWLEKNPAYVSKFDHQTIADELEVTYDRLLNQKKILDKVTSFHSQLTESVAKENSLQHVLKTAHNLLNVPIIIQQANVETIALEGIDEVMYKKLLEDQPSSTKISEHNETLFEKTGEVYKMTTPIYLDNRVFATCSFIYEEDQSSDENNFLFLERLATVCALCFLKEKISFETMERLKISILDRLIHDEYGTIDDLKTHLHLLTTNVEKPYVSLVIQCSAATNLPIDYYDQLLQLSQSFKSHFLDALFTKNNQEIYVLLSLSTQQNTEAALHKIVKQMKANNPELQYKIGVSVQFNHLESFSKHLKEASQAVSLPRDKSITHYSELGLLGNFLENINVAALKQTASDQLKDLLKPDPSMKELLYTLYIYLINGNKLKETMETLALSLGGVQYRIRKIEKVLAKDLKDSYTSAYLLLLIEALIVMKEIKL